MTMASMQVSTPKFIRVVHFRDHGLPCNSMECLSRLRRDEQLTDVTLKAGGVLLPCHRVVLSAASPYFHTMFTSDFKEAKSPIVDLLSVDASTLRHIVNFVYSAHVTITTENVQNLLQASHEFQLQELQKACEGFMLEEVHISNCISFFTFAQLFNLERLQEKAKNVMLKEFESVVRTLEFKKLKEEQLIQYISDPNLDVPNEDAVFGAVASWADFDKAGRRAAFKRVLAHVRLSYCSNTYLYDVVRTHKLMSPAACQQYLEEAQMSQSIPARRHEISSRRATPRKSFRVQQHYRLVLIGGLTKEDSCNPRIWFLEEGSTSWGEMVRSPCPDRQFYGVCVTENGMLITGGYENTVKRDCFLLDLAQNKWYDMPDLGVPRFRHTAVRHCGQVYVVGGMNDNQVRLQSVECFNDQSQVWNEVAPMKTALSHPLVVSFGQCIYIFGGRGQPGQGKDVPASPQVYDPVLDEWSCKAEMPRHLSVRAAVTSVSDRIFLIGGNQTCMSYSPNLDTWTVLTPPQEKHWNAPAVVWKGKILVGGGGANKSPRSRTSVVEEYDPETNTWSYSSIGLPRELSSHLILRVDMAR